MVEYRPPIGRIVDHDNTVTMARWWKCDGCGRTLGEIVGGRVVVKIADRCLSLPYIAGVDQVCPRCQRLNVLEVA